MFVPVCTQIPLELHQAAKKKGINLTRTFQNALQEEIEKEDGGISLPSTAPRPSTPMLSEEQ